MDIERFEKKHPVTLDICTPHSYNAVVGYEWR